MIYIKRSLMLGIEIMFRLRIRLGLASASLNKNLNTIKYNCNS
jgi:hypothetical protein